MKKTRSSSCSPSDDCCGKKAATLAEMVDCNLDHPSKVLREQLQYFSKPVQLSEAIAHSARSVLENGHIHKHQRRIGFKRCETAAKELAKHAELIKSSKSFDDLLSRITKLTRRIPRFRKLSNYDAALRIGFRLKRMPIKIYLHAGTKKGARALNLKGKKGEMEMDQIGKMYPELLRLQPYEIENFFCIYKKNLKWVRR